MTGETSPTEIGDYVTVGHGAILHGCRIGNGYPFGMGAIIIDDVAVGKGSLIATGSLVKSGMRIPADSVVAGNPATIRRKVTKDEAQSIIQWAKRYRDYTKEYLK